MSDKPEQTPASAPSQASDEISEKNLEGVAGGLGVQAVQALLNNAQAKLTNAQAKLTGLTKPNQG